MDSARTLETVCTDRRRQELLSEARWYAAYTSANHEKRVAAELERRSVEFYLPTYYSVRRWKDRRVRLALPLFPSYIFVHFPLQERLRIVQIPGVAHLVGFGDGAVAVPETEIARIRSILDVGLRTQPHPFLAIGRRVRVKSGPLAGLQGILMRRQKRFRLIVSIELIMRSIAVELEESDLEPV